jgi:outer membrane immunogenic protein
MKKYFLATVSVLALSTAGNASDLPAKASPYAPVAAPIWTGFYLGIQGGVARHDATIDDHCFTACATYERSKTGGALGGLIGYNLQQGSFVYGLEGDWNWIGSKINETFNDGFAQTSNGLKWLATVRGRAGLAVDATLVYFTGGVAFGHVKNSIAALNFDGSTSGSFSESKTKTGWTAGVGVEHIFSRHWTARAEFRYVDLGTTRGTGCTPGTSTFCSDFNYRSDFSNTLMMGLVGLNYKF